MGAKVLGYVIVGSCGFIGICWWLWRLNRWVRLCRTSNSDPTRLRGGLLLLDTALFRATCNLSLEIAPQPLSSGQAFREFTPLNHAST